MSTGRSNSWGRGGGGSGSFLDDSELLELTGEWNPDPGPNQDLDCIYMTLTIELTGVQTLNLHHTGPTHTIYPACLIPLTLHATLCPNHSTACPAPYTHTHTHPALLSTP